MVITLPEQDINRYMLRCIELGKQSYGQKPNVGAMVVSHNGRILSEGYKQFQRGTDLILHAERIALDNVDVYEDLRRAVLVTTLEPCAPLRGRKNVIFKSCAELIVERGIRQVIIGLEDDSKTVSDGMGISYLRKKRSYCLYL